MTGRTTPPLPARALLLAGAATSAGALWTAANVPWSMMFWSDRAFGALVATLAASVLLSAFAAAPRRRRAACPTGAGLARGIATFALVAAVPWFYWLQPFKALWLLMYAGCATGAFAVLYVIAPWTGRCGAVLAKVGAALALSTLGVEVGLRFVSWVFPHPLLAAPGSTSSILATYRKTPGEMHLGFACDPRGFADHLRRADGSRLVTVIGDSFGIGVVPPPFHYTTAAEERLPGTEFYSAAVIAAGPAEYEVLLREELLTDEPDLLLIALFVGNDVEEASRFDPAWPLLRTCFDRSSLRIALLLDRLGRIDAERDRSGSERPTAAVQGEAAPRVEDRRESLIRFPWLDDPSLEEATLSAETFLEVESRRARFVCAPDAGDRYEPLFRALRAIRAAAGSIPIGVVLIPDEFQVEDAIWNQVAEQGFERDLPQQRIGAWLRGEGIPTLDLLPTFRAFAPGPDGQRHLYHLRDTHWNRRGNALAGAELAAFAERLLDR
ncbi:MAG: hypothetical protein O2865_11375 [Planctomycetota bacterium]|nr:hypothetical protein [Planctomycetota bacterium]MDA0933535.1 hypothetical protein [Planctomycetota bacterium]MDA1223041.1 hypothetical protein [Planctomycetota bacterium]